MEIIDNDYEDYGDNPETEILLAESNPDAAEACSLAADYRADGYSPSQALKRAWQDVKGEGNPEFEPSTLLVVLVLVGAGIGVYRMWKGVWPWQALGIGQANQLAIAASQRAAALRRQQQQQSQSQSHSSVIPIVPAKGFEYEAVNLLVP